MPADQDKDTDGLPDDWEVNGVVYVDPTDGSEQRLDLKRMGASPAHKDMLLWLVWMESGDHTHQPDPQAIATVKQAFRAAPVTNPDGLTGINLHIVLGRKPVQEVETLGSGTAANYDWSAFNAVKTANLPTVFQGTAFFTVFAHHITAAGNSGIARSIPGRDFIVSLAGFTQRVGTSQEKAGTLMHELGHTLGLRHGGADDVQWKPNYLSVMNYSFQLNGLWISNRQGNFDYSRFRVDAEEQKLDEEAGLSKDALLAQYGTIFYCCDTCQRTPKAAVQALTFVSSRVDWNCDAAFGAPISSDINRDGGKELLSGANDWDNIVLKPSSTAGLAGASVVGTRPDDELTPTEADRLPLFPVSGVRARPIGNGVLLEWERVPLDRVVAYKVYRAVGRVVPELVATVEDTANPSYADVSKARGALSYSVSAVFVPHAYQPEVPPPPPPPPPGKPQPSRTSAPVGRWIGDELAIKAIAARAPTATAEMEALGGLAPPMRDGPPFKALRETAPSQQVGVIVK